MTAAMSTASEFQRQRLTRTAPESALVNRVASNSCRSHRFTKSTYRRRRVAAVALGIGVLSMAGKAGATLGTSSPSGLQRSPHVVTVIAQPGDTLWSIAQGLEPGSDPRRVVHALERARGEGPLQPGERIVWQP